MLKIVEYGLLDGILQLLSHLILLRLTAGDSIWAYLSASLLVLLPHLALTLTVKDACSGWKPIAHVVHEAFNNSFDGGGDIMIVLSDDLLQPLLHLQ